MLEEKLMWLKLSDRIRDELIQCRYEGRCVEEYEAWARGSFGYA